MSFRSLAVEWRASTGVYASRQYCKTSTRKHGTVSKESTQKAIVDDSDEKETFTVGVSVSDARNQICTVIYSVL